MYKQQIFLRGRQQQRDFHNKKQNKQNHHKIEFMLKLIYFNELFYLICLEIII